jgi:hypothetical protein
MYAVGFINFGNLGMINPMGNDGLQKLHNRTLKGWNKELQTMKKCVDEIYIMRDFTQKMCEMNQARLFDYCLRNNIIRIK